MSNLKMSDVLFKENLRPAEEYEELYKPRNLPEGTKVTRVAPSPTGYLHLGTLYVSLIDSITAGENGVFYVRIEDTDKKREVEGGVSNILNGLKDFGINPTEGYTLNGEIGSYGPYKQSLRKEIYQSFAKSLVDKGLAYPCFCTAEELNEVRAEQEKNKERTGYYGKYAKHRNITPEKAQELINEGKPFVVRFKSMGSEENKIKVEDLIKGKIEMPENDEDFVILKSDGIPTYHFAHAVDDHLMRTTHIIRGDEWLSSLPKHIQLFKTLGFKVPKYAHIAPIMKLENGNKRKISKRKDPEAAVSFFKEQGFPAESVIEYLMSVASSEFEAWRKANPNESYTKFKFNLKKMSLSGALFDGDKLNDVSKNVISKFSAEKVTNSVLNWAKEYNTAFYEKISKDTDYLKAIFSIDRDVPKPRKDIAKWSDAESFTEYFYNYNAKMALPEKICPDDAIGLLSEYKKVYTERQSQSEWFEDIKQICEPFGFCANTKEYRVNPQNYKGSVGDVSTLIRLAITSRQNSPDLFSIMLLLKKEECFKRIDKAIALIEELKKEIQ